MCVATLFPLPCTPNVAWVYGLSGVPHSGNIIAAGLDRGVLLSVLPHFLLFLSFLSVRLYCATHFPS